MTTVVRYDRAARDVVWTTSQEGCAPTAITRAARIAHVIIGSCESACNTPHPPPGTLGGAGSASDLTALWSSQVIQSA
jgi:hypothetical protein